MCEIQPDMYISFLERNKLTSSNSHMHKSFADIQEAQTSTVCILEIHKYGQGHIVLWAQSLM